jgi:hypothetical protein
MPQCDYLYRSVSEPCTALDNYSGLFFVCQTSGRHDMVGKGAAGIDVEGRVWLVVWHSKARPGPVPHDVERSICLVSREPERRNLIVGIVAAEACR